MISRSHSPARFTISPLHEAVNSLWPVYAGWAEATHGTWAARVRAHPGIDHVLLGSLVSQRKKIPDFIAPPPRPRLADQLLQVRNFGETTLQEVRERLSTIGLRLGMKLPHHSSIG